jgi:sulfonate transport system substrate-binding protein
MATCGEAVDYGPYYVAKHKGWFDTALQPYGATVTHRLFQSVAKIEESLAANAIDCMFEAEIPAIVLCAAGIDSRIVNVSCSLNQEIVVRNDSGIFQISDLRDRKVTVLEGSSSHYGLLTVLNGAGLSTQDLSIINMSPPEAQEAFRTKKVDAWAIWPPFVEEEELAGTAHTLPAASVEIYSVTVMRNKFLMEQPDISKAIIGVLTKTKQWVAENIHESENIIAEELDMPLPVVERAFSRHNWRCELDELVLSEIQRKADFLKSVGAIQTAVDVRRSLLDLSLPLPLTYGSPTASTPCD